MAAAYGFPKAVRLRKRRDYLSLQREGSRRHTPQFVVVWRPGAQPRSRLGVTVSTRVGGAVQRNRVKRFVREVFRRRRGELRSVVDVLVIAKPGAAALGYDEAARQLERGLDLVPQG